MKQQTKIFAVIGDPINHTLSPVIHNSVFKQLKMNCSYIAYRIKNDELKSGIESLKSIKISGFNVTSPHKVSITEYIDELDNSSRIAGSINTVLNKNGYLKGYNTDIGGFIDSIKKRDLTIKNSTVLILGAGGSARSILVALAKENIKNVVIADRTGHNIKKIKYLSNELGINIKGILLHEINYYDEYEYDFIINSTPMGLKNEPSIIPDKIIKPTTVVYDLVYKPMLTNLIKQAKKNNAIIIYGYEMLLNQAIRSFKIWHNKIAPYDTMKKAVLQGF